MLMYYINGTGNTLEYFINQHSIIELADILYESYLHYPESELDEILNKFNLQKNRLFGNSERFKVALAEFLEENKEGLKRLSRS